MLVASWNLNHRVGHTRYRAEAPHAAVALGAELLLFNEYFPKKHAEEFTSTLAVAGWTHQLISADVPGRSNRILAASRTPLELDSTIPLAAFDDEMPANSLVFRVPETGVRVLALRVPAYSGETRALTIAAWDWIERTATSLVDSPAIIIGDLNAHPGRARGGGTTLARILQRGWMLGNSQTQPSYISPSGNTSTLDHLLYTPHISVTDARYVRQVGSFLLAGTNTAISDHAALVAEVSVNEPLKH